MKPYGDDVVNVQAQLRGYGSACERFGTAATGEDPVAAYVPLFEALNWAVALDDRIKDTWMPDGESLGRKWRERAGHGAEFLAGVRYARNSIHHHWADALRLDTGGRAYPRRYPLRYFEWLWRDVDEIPTPSSPYGRDVYESELAGRPAKATLMTLREAFRFVSKLLEPPVPHG
jgi:hypothetical protein